MPNIIDVDAQTAKMWMDQNQSILIDVREDHEVAQFSIPGAVHMPMSEFDIDALPSDENHKLVFVCAHGMRSQQVGMYLLQENKISEAYNLTGGVSSWMQAGLPG